MHQPSLRRLVSGLAVVATASALVATPVHAQSSERVAATSLSIRVSTTKIEPGKSARVTGHLAVAGDVTAAGRTVSLEAKPKGTTEFVPVAEVAAAGRGGLSVRVEPTVTTRYRWHFLGDTETRASRSGVATLRVGSKTHHPRRWKTSLSIRKVFRKAPLGGIDIVRGRLRGIHGGLRYRPVILLSKVAGSVDWTYEGTRQTNRKRVVKFVVDPSVDSAYRLVFLGNHRLRPARSGSVKVPHRPDVAITATPSTLIRGESATISGLVTDNGAPLVGATVVLWKIKVGPVGTRRVAQTGITDESGNVVFVVEPNVSTKYRLRVVRGEDNDVALSAVVRVAVTPASQ